ncbi:Bax inhibitor-1/YccA family protein [Demequina capsici]|uniref:Bax inhibitor-1/YccA family protein n=1 Tax=Demequina capsici TaxID=3075620 RepID=A0AA96F8C3_9MICO|nr:Bax inhibitor-1/YccA family protein [Demequina sp. OYTSA14]WNM25058.1 Bax inhibitor-1/YccA family protein [Demequina sp. OYTSA14]
MANPFFTQSKDFTPEALQRQGEADAQTLQATFDLPAAQPAEIGRMSYEGTILKTFGALILLGIAAAASYMAPVESSYLYMMGAALAGFVVAMIASFRRKGSAALTLVYALLEGVFLGAFTHWIEVALDVPGAGLQALLATGVTFAVTLALYRSGKVRYTPKFQRFLMIGMVSYLVFSLINLGVMLFSSSGNAWGMLTGVTVAGLPLGVIIGVVAVILACMSLIADFDFIERGVKAGAPAHLEWKGAFGLIVTLVWLYTEILRIIAIFNNR